ncbi:hypothetical protein [Aestuariivirga sp.]|uniref:hypothetical protein n=1 Tax=Aestuariivirga sp. TaxID=2650926 RepID=UPI003593D988
MTDVAGLPGNAARKMFEKADGRVVVIDRMGAPGGDRDVIECDVTDVHGLHGIARRSAITGGTCMTPGEIADVVRQV